MTIICTPHLTAAQKKRIFELWNEEYPDKLKHHDLVDFQKYLDNLPGQEHFLLIDDLDDIKGWSFTFTRNNEKWFAILLDHNIHRSGYGTLLLNNLKSKETKLSGWVVDHNSYQKQNGASYISPLNFYLRNGFVVIEETRLESDKISARKIEWTK